MSVMLYKYPASKQTPQNKFHGDYFDYIIVDESEVYESISNGWSKTTAEAKEPKGDVEENTKPRRGRRKKNELD